MTNNQSNDDWRIKDIIHEDRKLSSFVITHTVTESRDLWDKYIQNNIPQFMRMDINIWNFEDTIERYPAGWDNVIEEEKTREFLCHYLSYQDQDQIILFPGRDAADSVSWNIFLKYWSDFIYLSDAGFLIVNPKSELCSVYIEDRISVFKRSLLFEHSEQD
ncbi:MAG: hypothetical protein COA78_05200 [Blastopirellula sp.]|nr:MAG: hypothetical protein COA78_05200 [Blastopirellula sp.]